MADLHPLLARARERARYSQDDVGAALGVSRAMVSYWEAGSRTPNDRQLAALGRLYGIELADLLQGRETDPIGIDLTGMLLRADNAVDPESAPGLQEFVQFLERFAELSSLVGVPIRGMTQSPYVHRSKFTQKDDARRKAEEVRAHLGLGAGPVADMDTVCEMLGITIYRAPLGGDLRRVPSGAFLNHPTVGFSILVNLDMTPGRRRFTVAHEISHALFHSSEERWVISQGRNPREDFADDFAGEFLMPSEGVRRFIEEAGMPPRISEDVDVIHIQRHFRVSFPTALVRLKQMNAITTATYQTLRAEVRPVGLARSLGYRIDPEEYQQDAELWRIRRFPRTFLRMLRHAVVTDTFSPPSAASFAGVAISDLVQILGQPLEGSEQEPEGIETEFAEFEDSGVVRA
jgi:Zn-dependent peptidase ImmA (M78 family)/transcriptional regulator with XRE-family HTH domain